jgi:hypothetical protein
MVIHSLCQASYLQMLNWYTQKEYRSIIHIIILQAYPGDIALADT